MKGRLLKAGLFTCCRYITGHFITVIPAKGPVAKAEIASSSQCIGTPRNDRMCVFMSLRAKRSNLNRRLLGLATSPKAGIQKPGFVAIISIKSIPTIKNEVTKWLVVKPSVPRQISPSRQGLCCRRYPPLPPTPQSHPRQTLSLASSSIRYSCGNSTFRAVPSSRRPRFYATKSALPFAYLPHPRKFFFDNGKRMKQTTGGTFTLRPIAARLCR